MLVEAKTKEQMTDEYRRTSKGLITSRPVSRSKERIEDWVGDGTIVSQFDLIIYRVGSRFKKHIDNYNFHDIKRKEFIQLVRSVINIRRSGWWGFDSL